MKVMLRALLATLACISCAGDSGNARVPFQRLDKADLRAFGCSPSPAYLAIVSAAELNAQFRQMEQHCSPADASTLRIAFLDSLGRTPILWERDALVIVGEYYGTGMAKARLDLTQIAPDELKATIVWTVPPPPVTPDTVVYRFAFVVDKTVVRRVRISGREQVETVLDLAR
jgi:hypothetical protein